MFIYTNVAYIEDIFDVQLCDGVAVVCRTAVAICHRIVALFDVCTYTASNVSFVNVLFCFWDSCVYVQVQILNKFS